MSEVVLTVENVSVRGKLREVSMRVSAGEIHCILGPNGAGKSTLLRCIAGTEAFQGKISHTSTGRLALVPQTLTVPHALPVTVAHFLKAFGDPRAAALEAAGIGHLKQRVLSELSQGELKRVLLVHALNPRPALLLLDEPEAALDVPAREALVTTLKSLAAQGVGVVLVTHEASSVAAVGTHRTLLGDA